MTDQARVTLVIWMEPMRNKNQEAPVSTLSISRTPYWGTFPPTISIIIAH